MRRGEGGEEEEDERRAEGGKEDDRRAEGGGRQRVGIGRCVIRTEKEREEGVPVGSTYAIVHP